MRMEIAIVLQQHGAREKAQSPARTCHQIERELLAGADANRGAEAS
jgi:hypothetical protein